MQDGKVWRHTCWTFMMTISNDRLNELSGIQSIKLTIYSVTLTFHISQSFLIVNRFKRTTPCPTQKGLMGLFSLPQFIDKCTRQRSPNRRATQGTGIFFIIGFEAARLLPYTLRFGSPQVFRDWHRMRCQLAPTWCQVYWHAQ